MLILHKYVLTSFFKYFILIQVVVLSVYLSVDFTEKADNLADIGFTLGKIFILFLHKVPFIVIQITPISLLLSIIATFSFMAKNNELMALQNCGINLKILIKSSVVMGIWGTLMVVFTSELSVSQFDSLDKVLNNTWKKENVWIKKTSKVIHIKEYFYINNEVRGITINYFDESSSKLVRRLDAEKGVFDKTNVFMLQNVIDQRLETSSDFYNFKFHDILEVEIDITKDDFEKTEKTSNEMGLFEIYKYAKELESQGYKTKRYWVDCYNKTSFYLVCLVFSFVGTAVVLGRPKRNAVFNISYGIFLVFIYWTFHSLCLSLGYIEIITPYASAWLVTLAFLFASVYVLMKIE